MTPLALPVSLPISALAELRISREELRAYLGPPHSTENDPMCTHGGDEDFWAYRLLSGQRIAVELHVARQSAVFYADPPWLMPLLLSIGLSPSDHRLTVYPAPVPLK
jgi:hypothetical protein